MSSYFIRRRGWATLCLLGLALGSACTQIHVEDTKVIFNNAVCKSDNAGGNGFGGGSSPGGSSAPQSTAQMDTYVVQIYELKEGETTAQSSCDTCLATRSNCFLEKAACVCGALVEASPAHLPEMLQDLRVPVPAKYNSLYCLRIMGVERTSESEQCQCDSAWWKDDRVRLCSLSRPYAASSFPVNLDVQCSNNRSFSTCLGQPQPPN